MKIITSKKLFIYFSLLLGINFSVVAETVYVSDSLRVGVRAEPDNTFAPIGVVKTGMKLEVLDRQQGYLKIKTVEGLTGWIKNIYIIENAPAIIKLQQLQKNHEALTTQNKELQTTLSALEKTNSSLTEQVEELKEDRSRLQLLQAKSISHQQEVRSTWYWWLIVLFVVIIAGFFSGMQWSRHQTMKRLGGLRL